MPDRPNPLATPRLWDLVADDYLRDIAPRFALYADDALRLAGVAPGSRVLDVACGPGFLAIEAAPIRFARESLAERWPEIDGRITDLLRARWGTGPQCVVMTANLALGLR